MNTDTLERLVRRMVKTEAANDSDETQGREFWWGELVLRIIDVTDADREKIFAAIADYIAPEGS